MRLSILPILLAGAAIVTLSAAEPIRVANSHSSENANIRFGHELANANVNGNDDSVARIVVARPMILVNPPLQESSKTHHSCGATLREKAIRFSNAIRHALGMPLIETHVEVPRPGRIHILPAGYPSHNVIIGSQEDQLVEDKPGKHPDGDDGDDGEHHHHRHHGHHHHHHTHHHKHRKSFLRRIHRAVMALGPWEGRAVAFVLGCGIGVLLRMFWVLTVLTYRTVRGEHDEAEPEYIVYEQVPEDLFVAPPQYVDEKFQEEASEEIEERK